MASILIIDDDELLCETLSDLLSRKDHTVSTEHTIVDGLKACSNGLFDIVLLDVQLPDGKGLDIIPELKKAPSEPEIIIITGHGDANGAEVAIKSGAWCYLEKTSIARELLLPLTRVLQYRDEKSRKAPLRILNREAIIGSSPQLNKCLKLLANAASSDVNVLITGETGTGKEIFASTIHQNSPRDKTGNFVVVDCAALPDTLVESILFGHAKGAFTGADKQRKGLVQQADEGTLFLDEIGELPLNIQKSFLRVLEEGRFRPVGSSEERTSDFRLIAATNRTLDEMVKNGKFREDLLFRLRSLVIDLPPLRDRGNDIQELASYCMNKISSRCGDEIKGFTPEFFEAIMTYRWPGNVRELFHAMERVFATASDSKSYYTKHLPENIRVELAKSSLRNDHKINGLAGRTVRPEKISRWKDFKENVERDYIKNLLSMTNNNIADACRVSGLSRARLYQLISKHSLHASSSRDDH